MELNKTYYILIFIFSFLFLQNTEGVAQGSRKNDSLALIALYKSTNGPQWTSVSANGKTSPWDTSKPMTTWFGVRLNNAGRVVCLDLDGVDSCDWSGTPKGLNLNGKLPNEIGNLTELTSFYIIDNRGLEGEIPSTIGNLTKLSDLIFITTGLSGSIPTSIGRLTELIRLYLTRCKLSGSIPNEIGNNLRKLEFLSVANNKDADNSGLSGVIPSSLGNLSALKGLELYSNILISEIPKELGNLFNLEYLTLNDNQLEGSVPASFSNLKKLKQLHFDRNKLTAILKLPDNLENTLEKDGGGKYFGLRIRNNKFTFKDILPYISTLISQPMNAGDISRYAPQDSIFKDTTIEIKTGVPIVINLGIDANITSNRYQWYKNNSIYGSPLSSNTLTINNPTANDAGIYHCIVTNPNAPQCTLISRKVTLRVSCAENDRTILETFYKATNGANWVKRTENGKTSPWDLTKSISTWYGVETNTEGCVIRLLLDSLNLNGSLPASIGNLSEMIEFRILGNKSLKGNIPVEIGQLKKLVYLNLSYNGLTGNIPSTISNMDSLEALALSDNMLDGSIPNLRNKKLRELLLWRNSLRGTMPDFDLPNLKFLNVEGNKTIEGSLPEFKKCPQLEYLNARTNNIRGILPSFETQKGTITHVFLDVNMIEGFSSQNINLPNLQYFALSGNQIRGNIPNDMSNLTNLIFLDIAGNKLEGEIPPSLGNLKNIKEIRLHRNKLSGKIPTSLAQLSKLETLLLSENELEELPDLSKLPNLKKDSTATIQRGIRILDNKLTFKSILPNVPIANRATFFYHNQKPFSKDTIISAAPCGEVTINIDIDREVTDNIYKWYKGGQELKTDSYHLINEKTGELTIKSFSGNDAGDYTCKVTNPRAKDLTLNSGKFSLKMDENATLNIDAKDIFNGITLNGDELNQYFKIKGMENCVDSELRVYNKFGVELYNSSSKDKNGFDGTVKGNPLPEGTYFFLFYPTKGSKKPLRGNILILR